MKPVDINSITHIDFIVKKNDNDPKFKRGDHVITSKRRNIFAKCYSSN